MNFLEQAQRIVAAYRAQAPEGYDPQAFDAGGGSQNTRSTFKRKGSTTQQKQYSLPSDLSSLIQQSTSSTATTPDAGASELGFLTGLTNRSPESIPGQSVLDAIKGIDPSGFQGASGLQTQMARNPFSTDYEEGMRALFDRQYATMRAGAMSGPQNVRGAQDRMGLELGQLGDEMALKRFGAIRGDQQQEAGVVQQATQIYNTIENMRRGTQMQAQGQEVSSQHNRAMEGVAASGALQQRQAGNTGLMAMASEMFGNPKSTQVEDLRGSGTQNSSSYNWGAGLSCCFIFLEALNGPLPFFVRKGRDEFVTQERRDGYMSMAKWLIPKMQKSSLWKRMVNFFMVKPFLIHGRQHYSRGRYGLRWMLTKPICMAWIYTWQFMGKKGI